MCCDQILSIYAGTRGFLDDVPIAGVTPWEAAFLQLHARPAQDIGRLIGQSLTT